jgi:hypothetical protein
MMMLKALSKVMSPRTYQLDEVLYYEGEKAMNLIIIAVGECVGEVDIHSEQDILAKTTPHYLAPKVHNKKLTSEVSKMPVTAAAGAPAAAAATGSRSASPRPISPLDTPTHRSVDMESLDSSSQLSASIISKQHRESRVRVGRLGPATILAPFVAVCESIMEEVYHKETVTATTLVQTYVIFKNDFIHHIQEPMRSEIRKLLKASPTYIMPDLWNLHTKPMGERDWKSKKAWDLFKKDLRAGKTTSITSKLGTLKHVHRTDANGTRLLDDVGNSKAMNTVGGSKLASTLAGFTEAFLTRSNFERSQIKKLTASFKKDHLVDIEIHASKRRVEEKSLLRTVNSQPDFRKQNVYIPPEDRRDQEKSFGMTRNTVIYPAAMAEVLSRKQDPTISMQEADVVIDPTSFVQAKSLVTASAYPYVQYPYSLIHIHRENFSADNKAIQPRVSYCYYRLSGTMETLLEAKSCAARQMKHAYINCLTHDTDIDQPEIILDWRTFASFDTIGVSNTDFFLTYFRSVPMEYASFTPKVNLLNKVFPAEGKSSGQLYSCVKFNKVSTSGAVDDPFRGLLKPKYIQELGIMKEVLASTFSLADCCSYLLLNSAEGRELRLRQQRAHFGDEIAGVAGAGTGAGSPDNHSTSRTEASPHPSSHYQGSSLSSGMSPLSHQKSGLGSSFGRLDTGGTAGRDMHEDADEIDEYDEDTKQQVTCVVPLYQWISMAPESFESMRLSSLLFAEEKDDIILVDSASTDEVFDPNAADTNDAAVVRTMAMAGSGAPRTMTELKYSLREAGLLPPTDDDGVVTDTDIIERTAIKRHQEALRAGAGMKLTEENTVKLDMQQIVDINGRTRHVANSHHRLGDMGHSTRSRHGGGGGGPLKPLNRATVRHTQARGVSGLSVYEEGLLDEERANIVSLCNAARDNVVRMNDDFCYGELYTPFDQRVNKVRLPSSASARVTKIVENESWNAVNLAEQGRKLRTDLEEHAKVERFRHNPVVTVGVDRGTAEGHLTLLEAMDSLPTHSKLMAQKKDEIHQQAKLHAHIQQQPTVSKSASTSVLGVVRGPRERLSVRSSTNATTLNSSNNVTSAGQGVHGVHRKKGAAAPTIGVSSSLPALHAGAASLAHRLDVLHDVLNDSLLY